MPETLLRKRLRVLIAPDSFKGSLRARPVAIAISAGLRASAQFSFDVDILPMSDGGEGFVESLLEEPGSRRILLEVCGPLPSQRVTAGFLYNDLSKKAFVAMSDASGLELIPPEVQDPRATTTFGTGELVRHALGLGARTVVLGIGGSATNDGGAGALQALGFVFRDAGGEPLPAPLCGRDLAHITSAEPPAAPLPECNVLVACDVTNPLLGVRGAAAVYGPQKGAGPAALRELEAAMESFAARVLEPARPGITTAPGAGAAGGLGAGLAALLGAELLPGVEIVAQLNGLNERVAAADVVISGEGRLDDQSLQGKVCGYIAATAKRYKKPCFMVCGVSASEEFPCDGIFALCPHFPQVEAIQQASECLESVVQNHMVPEIVKLLS